MDKKILSTYTLHLFGVFLLLIPAFYNSFPIVFSDTAAYIRSGFTLEVPLDRPLVYGLFTRFVSLGISLWWVVCIQSVLLYSCLYAFYQAFFSKLPMHWFFAILFVLGVFTGAGWYTSQVMPDVFTPIAALCASLVLFSNKPLLRKLPFLLLLVCSIAMHSANLVMIFLLILILTVLFFLNTRLKATMTKLSLGLVWLSMVASVFTIVLVHGVAGGYYGLNKGTHAFLPARLVDTGLLKSFLQENCANNHYELCNSLDNFPEDSRAYLWNWESPLNQNGGWEAHAEENKKLLRDFFTSPKYVVRFGMLAVTSTLSQLLQNSIGANVEGEWYSLPTSPPYQAIDEHFPASLNAYLQSRQNTNLWGQTLHVDRFNIINLTLFTLSGLFIIVGFKRIMSKSFLTSQKLASLALLLCIIFNAMATAGLSNIYNRLQARVSWLFIFVVLLLAVQLVVESQTEKTLKSQYHD